MLRKRTFASGASRAKDVKPHRKRRDPRGVTKRCRRIAKLGPRVSADASR